MSSRYETARRRAVDSADAVGTKEGIELLQADDFQTWILSLEVKGESLYKVGSLIKLHLITQSLTVAAPSRKRCLP
jgi:hypothetical protein